MSNIKQMSDAERKRRRLLAAWEIEKRKLLREMKELGEELARTEAERDRAVDAAVAMEQEIAKLKVEKEKLIETIKSITARSYTLLRSMDYDTDVFGLPRYTMAGNAPCDTCKHMMYGAEVAGIPMKRCDIQKKHKRLTNAETGEICCAYYEGKTEGTK